MLGDIQDWCISRQLWWGHPIPAWRDINATDERWIVAENVDEAHALVKTLYQSSHLELVQVSACTVVFVDHSLGSGRT